MRQKTQYLLFFMLAIQSISLHAMRNESIETMQAIQADRFRICKFDREATQAVLAHRLHISRFDRNDALFATGGCLLLTGLMGIASYMHPDEAINKALWTSVGTTSAFFVTAVRHQYRVSTLQSLWSAHAKNN